MKSFKQILESFRDWSKDTDSNLPPKGEIIDLEAINSITDEQAEDLVNILQGSYGEIGGHPADTTGKVKQYFSGAVSADVDDDPNIDLSIMYGQRGNSRKASAIATDGGPEAKAKLRQVLKDFFSEDGNWIEVSGAPANILVKKLGLPTLEDQEKVENLLSHVEIKWHGEHPKGNEKGYGRRGWYSRTIPTGEIQTKIIVGNPPD